MYRCVYACVYVYVHVDVYVYVPVCVCKERRYDCIERPLSTIAHMKYFARLILPSNSRRVRI